MDQYIYVLGETIPVLDHGSVTLVDIMGSDQSIESAARVSYGGSTRAMSDTRGLLRYLMRHRHTSPFEMGVMIFKIKCPIFVARQWIRHRTASINEISGRYSVLPEEYWKPDGWVSQSTDNKQGRGTDHIAYQDAVDINRECFEIYHERLEAGISREMARTCLPLSTYTEFVWKMDIHNLLHFLKLRMDAHAQTEIRAYAEVLAKFVEAYFPITWEAFVDYILEAKTFSRMEMEILRGLINDSAVAHEGLSAREVNEFYEKFI